MMECTDRRESSLPAVAACPRLEKLVADLKSTLREDRSAQEIGSLLSASLVHDADLTTFIHFSSDHHTRHLIYRDERFELLVVCWPAGVSSPIHDHGASRCALWVVRGALRVTDYTLTAGGRQPGFAQLVESGNGVLRRGDIDVRTDRQDIHRVCAPDGDAVSLHVYYKPLERCLIFEPEQNECRILLCDYDTVAH